MFIGYNFGLLGGVSDATLANQTAIINELDAVAVNAGLIQTILNKLDYIQILDKVDYSIQIRTAATVPIFGVQCWVATDTAGSQVVTPAAVSNASGIVRFLLSPGNYYLFRQKSGLTFINPTAFTVAAASVT